MAKIAQLRTTPQHPWFPFEDCVSFEVAKFLFCKVQMSGGDIKSLMNLWAALMLASGGTPPFASHKHMYSTIDNILEGNAPWQSFQVTYSGPIPESGAPSWMTAPYEVWFQDPLTVVINMLENPGFEGEFDYGPFRDFDSQGDRWWTDLMSGDWA